MSSIGGILSIARTAIYANQTAIQTVSHNIANAHTEGYSRQRPTMGASTPVRLREGLVGSGVVVSDVARVRDGFLDLSVRRETANASGFGLRRDILQQVEGVFGEPSDTGLAASLDAFWSAWSDLANAPTAPSSRSAVRQRGDQVASTLNAYDRALANLENASVSRLEANVEELGAGLREVAALNERIAAAEVGGSTASDLRDARDLAIDRISRLVDVRTISRNDGSVSLVVGTTTLVDGNNAREVRASISRGPDGRVLTTSVVSGNSVLERPGSGLSGIIDGLDDIRSVRAQVDTLARTLVEQVNALHGSTPAGVPFFEQVPGGVTAGNIRLSDAVRADAANVLSGVGGSDNSIALALAGLRDAQFALTGADGAPLLDNRGAPIEQSIGGLYRDVVMDVAFRTSDVDRAAEASSALMNQALTRRESVSGVSIDEELMLLMRHQQAYTAATKLVNSADEMLQSILNMV